MNTPAGICRKTASNRARSDAASRANRSRSSSARRRSTNWLLITDSGHGPERGPVGGRNLPAEELDNAEDGPVSDGEGQGLARTLSGRSLIRNKTVALGEDVLGPRGLAPRSDAAREPYAALEARLPACILEPIRPDIRRAPERDAAEHAGLLVHRPEGARRTPEPFAEDLQDLGYRVFQAPGLRQHATDVVLSCKRPTGTFPCGHPAAYGGGERLARRREALEAPSHLLGLGAGPLLAGAQIVAFLL